MRGAGCKETGEKDSEVGKLIRVCVVMPRYTVQLSLKLGADLRSMFTGKHEVHTLAHSLYAY